MSRVKENRNSFLPEFESFGRGRGATLPDWAQSIRRSAMDRFVDLGFPTPRLERWKYTNVAPIAGTEFKLAHNGFKGSVTDIDPLGLSQIGASRFVFIGNHYSPELSLAGAAGSSLKFGSLAQFLKDDDAGVRGHLTRYADYSEHAFVALNTAFLEDGAFIQIPEGVVLEEPIYILFYAAGGASQTIANPRTLILAGRNSQVSIVEVYIGTGHSSYLTNAVTEIVLGENAVVDHYKLQQEADVAFHISTTQVNQARSASFYSHSVSLGGALVRNDVNVVLDGEGAECTLDGLYVESGNQHVDNHTMIDHAKAHGSSRELYKGILDGNSSGVFNGSVIVRKDAQKTDARQSNKNLLLSEGAEINTKPQLEIFADDVKCSHGATIGQIDQEAMFYLRSRGLDVESARGLLLYAFSNEIIDRVKPAEVRSLIADAISRRVAPGAGIVRPVSEDRI
jgi:Fe-S cluster assembly protein SufD